MLFRNTLAQSASFALGYFYSFLLAPLMISRLGLEAFGVWAVTGAVASYAGLLDLGVGRSLSRFIAVFDASGDERRMRECVGLGLIVVAVVAALGGGAAILLAPLLSRDLGVLDEDDMRLVLLASVAIWSFSGVDGVFNAVGIGKRLMVPPNVSGSVTATINFAFSLAALLASGELPVYAAANAAAALLGIATAFMAMRHVWDGPYFALPSRALIREVLGFSLKYQLAWFADLINLQTDKVIIALLVDVRAAAVYEIGSRVVYAVRTTAVMSVSAIVTTATARIVEEGEAVIEEMYRRYTRFSCGTAFPLFVLASVTAPFLLVAWLGSIPGDAGIVVPVLSVAYLVNITTGVGTSLAIGAGSPGVAATNSVQIAIANVILTAALAPFFGLWGVLAGTAIAIVVGSMAFNRRFLRLFKLSPSAFWTSVVPAGRLALALGVPPAALALLVGIPDNRPLAAALLVLSSAAYVLPYWVLASRRDLLPERLTFPPRRRAAAAAEA